MLSDGPRGERSEPLQVDLASPEDVDVDERRNASDAGAGVELPQRPWVRLD